MFRLFCLVIQRILKPQTLKANFDFFVHKSFLTLCCFSAWTLLNFRCYFSLFAVRSSLVLLHFSPVEHKDFFVSDFSTNELKSTWQVWRINMLRNTWLLHRNLWIQLVKSVVDIFVDFGFTKCLRRIQKRFKRVSSSPCICGSETPQTWWRSVTPRWPQARWASWLKLAEPPTCQDAGSGTTRTERPASASPDPPSPCPAMETAPPTTAGWRRRAPIRAQVRREGGAGPQHLHKYIQVINVDSLCRVGPHQPGSHHQRRSVLRHATRHHPVSHPGRQPA